MKNSFSNDPSNLGASLGGTTESANNTGPLSQILSQQQPVSMKVSNRPGTAGNRPASPGTGKIVKSSNLMDSNSSQKASAKSKPRLRSASPAGSQAANNSNGAIPNNQGSFLNNKSGAPNRSAIMSYTTSGTAAAASIGSRMQGLISGSSNNALPLQ